MGAVLEAEELTLERTVAMKVMLTGGQSSREEAQRFRREAKVLARLEHPNIVPIHDLGVGEDGQPYYTMKLVRGTTLHRVLDQIRCGDAETVARYPLSQLLTLFQKVCDAVSFAHSRGVIHRDLKPANLMLGDFGEVLVMDWGLAKEVGGEADGDEGVPKQDEPELGVAEGDFRTMEGRILGTPQFMAPEQAAGRIGDLDARTDVYALGGILYQILTLEPPVSGANTNEVLERIRLGAIRPPSSLGPASTGLPHCPGRRVPETLSAVAMKALAVDPDQRYPTVGDLQRDIAAYQGGFVTSVEEATMWRLFTLAVKRRRTEFTLVSLALAVIAVLGTASVLKVTRTLHELRRTAPTFHAQALALVEEHKFTEALERLDYALSLTPKQPDYLVLRGNILQALLRLEEARAAYDSALKVKGSDAAALANRRLCDKLLALQDGSAGLPQAAIEELHAAVLAQGRSAEALALAGELKQQTADDLGRWQTALAAKGWALAATKDPTYNWQVTLTGDAQASDLSPVRDIPAGFLAIVGGLVSDLTPLRDTRLRWLQITHGARIADLTPLKSLPLALLHINGASFVDASPLKGMPLEHLSLPHCTNLVDLRPLRGLRLKSLQLYTTYVNDLKPLEGMPIENLDIVNGHEIVDLSPLRGMPLSYLRLSQAFKLRDLSPLAGMRLKTLWLDAPVTNVSVLRDMPLEQLSLTSAQARDFSPIRGLPLRDFLAGSTPFNDVTVLEGMAITNLDLSHTPVSELGALRGMLLNALGMTGTKVRDLGPLQGAPLTMLTLHSTLVADLTSLRGMPLRELRLDGCKRLKDLTPLADCRELENLTIPVLYDNLECLRQLPKLKFLAYSLENGNWTVAAADFWTAYDARRRPAQGPNPRSGPTGSTPSSHR